MLHLLVFAFIPDFSFSAMMLLLFSVWSHCKQLFAHHIQVYWIRLTHWTPNYAKPDLTMIKNFLKGLQLMFWCSNGSINLNESFLLSGITFPAQFKVNGNLLPLWYVMFICKILFMITNVYFHYDRSFYW